MLTLPTGWIYDLKAGTGTAQGQKTTQAVQQIFRQEDIQHLFYTNTPATVKGNNIVSCPLARLRDVEQKGTEKRVIVGFTKGDNSPFFYAKFIEWGASSGPWSSQYYGKKPFMRPAYKAKVMESLEIFKKIIGKEITK